MKFPLIRCIYIVRCMMYNVHCIQCIHCTVDRFVLTFLLEFYKPSHL